MLELNESDWELASSNFEAFLSQSKVLMTLTLDPEGFYKQIPSYVLTDLFEDETLLNSSLARFALDDDKTIEWVVKWRSTHPNVLDAIALDRIQRYDKISTNILVEIFGNPSTQGKTLKTISDRRSGVARTAAPKRVWSDVNCDSDIIDSVVSTGEYSHSPRLLSAIVSHPNISLESLKKVAKNSYPFVRVHLANRANLDEEIKQILRNDPDEGVREALTSIETASSLQGRAEALDSATPPLRLQQLFLFYPVEVAHHPVWTEQSSRSLVVSRTAIELASQFAEFANSALFNLICLNPQNAILIAFCKDSHPLVLKALCQKSKGISILVAIASHLNASVETLEILSNNSHFQIKEALINNPNLPERLKRVIINNHIREIS